MEKPASRRAKGLIYMGATRDSREAPEALNPNTRSLAQILYRQFPKLENSRHSGTLGQKQCQILLEYFGYQEIHSASTGEHEVTGREWKNTSLQYNII